MPALSGDEIVTDNGYLYVVDQVLEPLETLYTEMSHEGFGIHQVRCYV